MNIKNLSYFEGKRILITGGGGFLGSSVTKKLSSVSCYIRLLDLRNPDLSYLTNCRAKIVVTIADITQESTWKKAIKDIDIIFHFAAQTNLSVATKEPVKDLSINLLPIVRLIQTCQTSNIWPDILFSGTVTQVGLTKIWPVNEDFIDRPITVYDIDKLSAEKYLFYYADQLQGRSCVLRLCNLYGPGPKTSSADRGILNMMIQRAIIGEPLTVYGKGNFVRDYFFIDDVVNAFLTAATKMTHVSGHHFILGTGVGHSIKEMMQMIASGVKEKRGSRVLIKHVKLPLDLSPIESRNFIADYSRFQKAVGWKPEVMLKEGIERTIDYYLNSNLVK